MPIHHFTLVVDGPDLQDDTRIGAVCEAGCDDAAIGRVDGIQYVYFDREAASLDQAILSAVTDLARIDGVDVVRIADAELVSMPDAAHRIGRTREGMRLPEERETKVETLRRALIGGEQSGPTTPFDFDVFIGRKKSTC